MHFIKGQKRNIQVVGTGCSQIDFDNAEQIILIVYQKRNSSRRLVFLKNPDEKYPNAGKIEKSDSPKADIMLPLEPEMTLNLPTGTYFFEIKMLLGGKQLILKTVGFFFELCDTVTN